MSIPIFFKPIGPLKAAELAKATGCELRGDGEQLIKNVATLSGAQKGDLTFLSNPSYIAQLPQTKASACILDKRYALEAPEGLVMLISDNVYVAYAQIATMFYPAPTFVAHISPQAYVSKNAKIGHGCHIEAGAYIEDNAIIGENCYVGANTYIGQAVIIGKDTFIAPNTTIICAQVGQRCIIHSGVRIGQDGFGFAPSKTGIIKVPQIGSVIIGNDVEIGANTCIDRGALEDTVIGDGTKMDNLIQIGHGARLGKSCVIVAQVAVAGSTVIGNGVMCGGQAGIAGHLNIGDGAMVAAQSGVMQNVEAGEVVGGTPSVKIRDWHRQTAILRRMSTKNKSEQKESNGQ